MLECTNTGKQQKRNGYGQKLADLLLECKGRGEKEAKNKKARCYSFHMCL